MGIAVYAEPQYGRYPGAYPSGYPTGYPTGYPMGYPASFIPGFRKYPAVAQKPQPASPNGRIFFLESTVFTTSTSTSSITCTYSTAALAACTGRKRRGILIDEEKETIAPSEVLSIIPTEEAKLEDLREKPDGLQDEKRDVEPSHFLTLADGGRLFFNIQYVTSTSTAPTSTTVSSLVTCAPSTGTIYGTC